MAISRGGKFVDFDFWKKNKFDGEVNFLFRNLSEDGLKETQFRISQFSDGWLNLRVYALGFDFVVKSIHEI